MDRQWKNQKQFFAEDISDDPIVSLAPMQSNLVSLQSNQNAQDRKDVLISELQEKAR